MEHLQHFGLGLDPFQIEPDLRFYYDSAFHSDAQRRVERGLRQGKGLSILTGEGGRTPTRFKHLVQVGDGRYRRLTPRELERLNGFPADWTATGMPDGRRAFMMGNALVVGLIESVGRELMNEVRQSRDLVAIPIVAAEAVAS